MPKHLVLILPLLLVACAHRHPGPAETRVPVVLSRPDRIQDLERIPVSGTLTSQGAPSLLAFQVPGRILRVLVREGEPVRPGQVVAEMDAVNLTHALEAAHAQSEAARAGAVQADQEHLRMKQLFESRSLAPNDFAKFTAARDSARQLLEQALAGEGVARKNLAEARLAIPMGGHVSRRLAEPGVMVAAGQPVLEVAALDPMEVNVGIPETDMARVKVGQAASITVPALPGRVFQGVVRVLGVSADPGSRTFMARIQVPNPGRELKVGMVAEASIVGARRLDLVTVPAEAIVRDAKGVTMVYQYYPEDRRVHARRVEVGMPWGRQVQIRDGLKGDELVVVGGQHGLREGMGAEPMPAGR